MTSGLRLIATEPVFLTRITATMDKKRSPQPPRTKLKTHLSHHQHHGNASDSDASAETNSLSADSANEHPKELTQFNNNTNTSGAGGNNRKKLNRRRGSEWEILEGLKDGQRFDKKPDPFNGYLHKKRKWPLKGWHKRYFVLDKGILIYAKSPGDITRGKKHGSVDIGLSVISTKDKRRRIDIDAEEFIYHLKAKTVETFNCWVDQLKAHRLYRHHILTYGLRDVPLIRAVDDVDTPVSRTTLPLTPPEIVSRDGSLTRGIKPIGGGSQSAGSGRLAAWVIDAGPPLDQAHKEVTQVQQNIAQLARILEHIEASAHSALSTSANTGGGTTADTESLGEAYSPNVKKDRKKFGLRKKKSSKGSSVDLTSSFCPNKLSDPENASPLSANSFSGLSPQTRALSASNSSLAAIAMCTSMPIPGAPVTVTAVAAAAVSRPQSLPGPEHLTPLTSAVDRHFSGTPDYQLRDDFTILAKDVVSSLRTVVFSLVTERDRLKAALDSDAANPVAQSGSGTGGVVANLRNSLNHALQQNSELKSRLARVHDVSDLSDVSSVGPASEICRPFNAASLSYSSSCVSASEFFDAEDLPAGASASAVAQGAMQEDTRAGDGSDTSSEAGSLSSEEGSVSSESELGHDYNAVISLTEIEESEVQNLTGRRIKLPVPRPDTEGLSLWNLLCKNIGKDLSQISMPVALNEPLNMLQRLCEELEYSELLDKAAELDDPYERMVYVAAFAVSSYANSSYRAGNKPFNPLLGETYECVREDKGFRFLAEQVSHHPPVSVCHAESKNFIFWQDARIKTKFWGKSMEFQPIGTVNVQLPRTGEVYQWNKVTTCVHNLFSGQRWVDQYGELKISNGGITCKLTFAKASYWSAKRHEVYGVITNEDGKVVRKLFGKWAEALYCGVAPSAKCIWRPGTMPEDYDMYYGFTRFAIELNELDPETARVLPPTDTRFRPDQRALEEGDLDAAENLKMQLEQGQRERRKRNEADGFMHQARWFSKRLQEDGELWEYNGRYWETRKNTGFTNLTFEALW